MGSVPPSNQKGAQEEQPRDGLTETTCHFITRLQALSETVTCQKLFQNFTILIIQGEEIKIILSSTTANVSKTPAIRIRFFLYI